MTDNTFEWNEESAKEYGKFCLINGSWLQWEDFKTEYLTSKKNKEQPIEITNIVRATGGISNVDGSTFSCYHFNSKYLIPKEKYDAIKKAIEFVLNEPIPTPVVPTDYTNIVISKTKLDSMMENVFNDARLNHPLAGMKYDSFNDYYNSLPENQKLEKDKDFEILSLKGGYMNENDILIELGSDKKYYAKGLPISIEIDYLLNICKSKIQSVRRLSDGITFSIGKPVKYTKGACKYEYFVIDNFFIKEDGRLLARSKDNQICEYISDIKNVTHVYAQPKSQEDKVLFTTEDGVDIYKDDNATWVDEVNFTINTSIQSSSSLYNHSKSYGKWFSSEEKAKEFQFLNKPCLSVNDIKWWLEKYFNYPDGISVIQLTELIKQKLHN